MTISPSPTVEVDALQDVALAVEGVQVADFEHHAAILPEIRFLHRAVGADLRRRSGGDHLAIDQHRDRVGEVEHHAHVVLHHHQRLALGHAADQRDGVFGFAVAHARGRFIEQDDAGAARDGHADLQRALFGVGQQARRHIAPCSQVQILQQPLGRLVQRALPRQQRARTNSDSRGSTAGAAQILEHR